MRTAGRSGDSRLVRAARELGALLAALAVWAGLGFLILAYGWRFGGSVWWFILLPLYLPAPVAAFVYTLAVRSPTALGCAKRGIFIAALGLVLANPFPLFPLFNRYLFVFLHYHMSPGGEDPLLLFWIGSIASAWSIGVAYCGYGGYWTGRLVARLRHLPPPPIREERSPAVPW